MFLESADVPNNSMQPVMDIKQWLEYALKTYGDHPAYARLNGKPLVVVYASSGYSLDTWSEIFDGLESRGLKASYLAMGYDISNLEVFDSIFDYSILDYPDLSSLYVSLARSVRNYNLFSKDSTPKIFMATVQPGFDNSYWPGTPLIVDRVDGQYYRNTLSAAVNSGADWIMVTTWNEFTEATNIEPSELYGDDYLQITYEYINAWKNK